MGPALESKNGQEVEFLEVVVPEMDDIKLLEVGEKGDHHEWKRFGALLGRYLKKNERCRFHRVDSYFWPRFGCSK